MFSKACTSIRQRWRVRGPLPLIWAVLQAERRVGDASSAAMACLIGSLFLVEGTVACFNVQLLHIRPWHMLCKAGAESTPHKSAASQAPVGPRHNWQCRMQAQTFPLWQAVAAQALMNKRVRHAISCGDC